MANKPIIPGRRRLRHWKQRFDPKAKFIWSRSVKYKGEKTVVGAEIPSCVQENRAKLRRFWQAKVIELAHFEAPNVLTGKVETKEPVKAPEPLEIDDLPEGVTVERAKGSWFVVTDQEGDEHKVNGQKALDQLLDAIREADEQDDDTEDEIGDDDQGDGDQNQDEDDDAWLDGEGDDNVEAVSGADPVPED